MAAIVQFYVNDTSPAILYSPIGDTLSTPNSTAGWNPYYTGTGHATAQGVRGEGTSFHTTSLDGASLTIAWIGTGIQLHGNVTDASYTINLDGNDLENPNANPSANVLATLTGLSNERHTLTLRANIPDSDSVNSSIAFGRAIVQSTPPQTDSNTLYELQSLDSSNVAFLGRWSFASDQGAPIHASATIGDQAIARFRGVAFVLQGTTSPESGNYSVSVDNVTVSYSARSSFLAHDTLLHYSTGLDPNVTHTVVVKNEGGGTLSLLERGFGVYSSGSPLPQDTDPPPATPVVGSSAYPRGTIAAFALAGILAFLLFTGCLYFFFIYRPRKKYQLESERWRTSTALYGPKAEEAGETIEIGQNPPPAPDDYNFLHPPISDSHRVPNPSKHDSQKSSFLRWKREVETGRARDSLGIQFRHSDIYDEKTPDPRSQYDNGTILSSSDRTRSRTPSIFRHARFMTSLGRGSPSRASSQGRSKGKQKGKESRRPPTREDIAPMSVAQASTLGSLSYMTAPIDSERVHGEHLPAPPSYAASISHRSSDSPPSVPRSVTQSSSIPTVPLPKRKSRLMEDDKSPVTSYTSSLTPPYPVRDLSKEDRGSLMDQSIDETPTLLSGPAVRQLIRSLSPRTSKASFPRHQNTMSMELSAMSSHKPTFPSNQTRRDSQVQESQRTSRPLPVPPAQPPVPSPTRSDYTDDIYVPQSEPASPITEEGPPAPRRVGMPRSSGTFGPLGRTSIGASLFRGASASASSQQQGSLLPQLTPSSDSHFQQRSTSGFSAISPSTAHGRPRFYNRMSALVPRPTTAESTTAQVQDTDNDDKKKSDDPSATAVDFPLQVTPATPIPFPIFVPPFAASQEAGARESFLDMTHSSDVSAYSHSKDNNTDTSSLNNDARRYSTPPQMIQGGILPMAEERSRWSSSTTAPVSTIQAELGHDSDSSKAGSRKTGGSGAHGSGNESSPNSGSSKSSKSKASAPPAQLTIPPPSQFLAPHRQTRFSVSESSTRSDPVHVHPPLEYLESPTDSIPIGSGSDVDFRHSDSDGDAAILRGRRVTFEAGGSAGPASQRTSNSSSLYPFPGHLPAFHNPDGGPSSSRVHPDLDSGPPTPAATGLSTPNYLVQRVLGINSPAGSVTTRPGHSRTGSTTTTPFGSVRYDTSTTSPSHLRHGTTTTDFTDYSSRTTSSPKPRDNTSS